MINLCFHGIGPATRELEPGEAPYWTSPELYAEVLDAVKGRDDVAISFDDGNISDLTVGLPALRDRGLRATFFVLAGRLGRPGSLGQDDLRALRREGMTIGTHGMDHVPWRGLSPSAIERELVEAREIVEDAAGAAVSQAALPLGRYDRSLLRHLRRRGYARVFSSDRRPAVIGTWLQPRYSLRAHDTVDRLETEVRSAGQIRDRLQAELKGLVKRLR